MVTAHSFIESVRNLPSLPTTYVELKKTCENPRKGIDDIAAIIAHDQSLASRLLQMANSAFYGFPRRIETIPDAVGKIGISQIQSLVLATSVMDSFKFISPFLLDMKRFWKHSMTCAIASGLMARHETGLEAEALFVGGLLHDIGRLVIYLKSPADAKKLIERCLENRVLEMETEVAVFGFTHAEIGAALLERWNLPKSLTEMVRYHHKPSLATENKHVAYLIHAADFVVSGLRIGDSGELFVAPLDTKHDFKFPISNDEFPMFLAEVEKDSQQLCDIFCK